MSRALRSPALGQHLGACVAELRRRPGRRPAGDREAGSAGAERGFVLLEEIVAITLLMIVMAALATFFITVTQSTTYERARQSAVQLADTELDAVNAVSAGDLYMGRTQTAVTTQFSSAPPPVQAALQTTQQAWDTNAPVSTLTLPMTTTAVANSITYTLTDYLGNCWIPTIATLGTACTNTAAAMAAGTPYVRAVVSATWPGNHCPQVNGAGLCTYVTSGLISAQGDPTFNLCTLGAACGPAAPDLVNPGPQTSLVNSAVSLQMSLRPFTGVAPITWSATGLPSWLTLNAATGLITGTAPGTPAAAVNVTVTATDAFARTTQAAFTWTVVLPPTITGLTTPYTATVGVPIGTQTLPYTCPTSSCTYSLAGAPSGIGLATTSGGAGAASQMVSNTSGNLYLVGIPAASVAPSPTAYAADVVNQGASNYWRLDETSGSTGADSISGSTNSPLTEQPGVADGAAGALLTNADAAATFDGAVDGSAATPTAITGPQTFSEEIWFRTTSTSGGRLMGFGTATTGLSSFYDRNIYLDNSGHLFFGVCGDSCPATVSTPGTYNDGQWHQAVGTLTSSGISLYVDGQKVGTNTGVHSAQAFTGYWRLGGDTLAGWPNQPTSNYFAGTLDEASVYPTALTPAQVQQQYSDSGRVPFTVTVTPLDQVTGAVGVVDQAAWTVTPAALPTITGLNTPFVTTAGATITSQPLPYTCATTSVTCTYSLTGAPNGIGLALTPTGVGQPTQTVLNSSGTLYAVGTVSSSIAPASTAYAADVRNQGATDYWRMNETTGSAAVDSIGGNTLIEQSGVGHGVAGAVLSNPDTADTFDGSTAGYAAEQTLVPAPTDFSESIWFRTQTTLGGKLIGFASNNTSPSVANDRHIYLDNAGHLRFGTWANGPQVIASSGTYNDGQWHQAVGTYSVTGGGMAFYVDGVLIGTNPANIPYPQAGYWRIGGDSLASATWPGTYSSMYFQGTLDDASIYARALTAAQVQQQYADSGRVPFALTATPKDQTTGATGLNDLAAWTVDSPPTVIGLTTPFATTAGAAVIAQSLPFNCPLSSCSYSVSGAPSGIGLSLTAGGAASGSVSVSSVAGAIYLVGTVGTGVAPGSFSVTVTPKDSASGVTGPPATAAWTVYSTPSVSGLPATFRTTVGATITAQSLTYSCPAGTCTITLTGAPTGIGLSSTSTGTPQPSIAVNATTGPLYLVGTVGAGVTPGAFSLAVTTQDTASQVTGTTANSAWTVFAPPSITGLTNPVRTNSGVAVAAQTLSYSCPIAACTYTVGGGVTGIGLSTTSTGAASASLSVTATTGTLYLVGTPTTAGTFTLTVTGSSSGVNGTAATAAWTVNAAPTVTGLSDPFSTTVAATLSQTVAYSCPSASCSVTVTGQPAGIGLDSDNVGAIANVLTVTGPGTGNIYLRGTVGAVTPGTYSVVLTPRDLVNNVTGTAIGATWTVYAAPTVNGLLTPFTTTAGAVLVSQPLPYTCPSSSCTYTLTGAPGGVGLNTNNGTAVANSVTVTGSTSGNIYLRGTVAASTAPSPTAYAADVRSQGASDYWRLNDTTGSTGADSIGTSPLAEQPGVSHGAGGAIASNSDTASTFDGSSVDGSASTTTAINAPQIFTEEIWFRTTTTAGGKLIGFGNQNSGLSSQYDRHIYMDNAGHLIFGVYNGSVETFATTGSYNDGQWHQAVGTLSGAGMTFFVDGVAIGANPSWTVAESHTGYWRIGGDNLSGWPYQANSNYFAGILGEAAIYPTALTAAQVQQQFGDSGRVPFSLTVTPADTASGVAGPGNQAAWTVYSPPAVTGLTTPFTVTAGATVANQTLPFSCPGGSCSFTLTGAPAGVGLSTVATGPVATSVSVAAPSGVLYLRGPVSSSTAPGTTTVAVTPTDTASGVVGTSSQANWTVAAGPSVSGVPSGFSLTIGEVLPNVGIAYTCPSGNCTFALNAAAPAGLVLSTGTNGGSTTSVTVSATSGTLYISGTIGTAATLGPYSVSVIPTDNVSGAVGVASTGTGTLYAAPTVSGQTTPLRTSVGATIANDALAYTCPSGSCTFTVANAPSGIGLYADTTTVTTASAPTSISVTATSGTIWLRGTILASTTLGNTTVVITPTATDPASGINTNGPASSSAWTLVSAMTLTAPPTVFVARGAVATGTFSYTCRTSNCTVSVTGNPIGTGLSTTSSGGTLPSSLTVSSGSANLRLRGTVTSSDPPGSYPITITLTDPAGSTITSTVTWTVL